MPEPYPYLVVLDPDADPAYPYVPTRYHKELYESHEPLNYADQANGWDWFKYNGAIARMFDQVDAYARDQADGTPGWGILLDINRCPTEALPWLAQFVGVTPLEGATDAQQRIRIRETGGFKRGTTASMIGAARQFLTGVDTASVTVIERDGSAYRLTVITYTSQTPDQTAVLNALMSQKPAGIVLTYRVDPGWNISQFELAYSGRTVANAETDFATINDLETHLP